MQQYLSKPLLPPTVVPGIDVKRKNCAMFSDDQVSAGASKPNLDGNKTNECQRIFKNVRFHWKKRPAINGEDVAVVTPPSHFMA